LLEFQVVISRSGALALWWAIQINAVAWFLALGVFLVPGSPFYQVLMVFAGLFGAAALEWLGFRHLYRPIIAASKGADPSRGRK
jgi:hypothetical protein